MNLIILPIVCAVAYAISLFLFIMDEKKTMAERKIESNGSKNSLAIYLYSGVMLVLVCVATVLFCTIYKDNNIFISLKRLLILCVIWPIAFIDYKTYRIPNTFIVFGLICRGALLPFEMIFEWNHLWGQLASEVIAAVALLLAAFLCSLCIKNSIGFGDMKLFVVMGLLLGLEEIWSAVFLALILSFILSAYLLISKKKSRKDAIPFGPALVIGTFLSVCLSGM